MISRPARLPLVTRITYASGVLGSRLLTQILTAWVFFFYAAEGAADREPLAPIACGSTTADLLGIRLIGPVAAVITIAGWVLFVRWYRVPEQQFETTDPSA